MSHLGTDFGDPADPSGRGLAQLEEADRTSLSHVEALDAEGFYASVAHDNERRKVCGLAPIYVLLRVCEAQRGQVLDYTQAVRPGATVSFAAVALWGEP